MLSSFLVCTMVVMAGAMAVNKPTVPMTHGPFGIPIKQVSDHENMKPCKLPRYFTYDEVYIVTAVIEGVYTVDYVNFEGAYDDIAKKLAGKEIVDYFNGTKYSFHVIQDYYENKKYAIYRSGDELVCYVSDFAGKSFPEEYSIKETAKYVGEATIGDRDLLVDNWYDTSKDDDSHTVRTVTRDGCVPVGYIRRRFHPDTGEVRLVLQNNLYNFRLGICDPEKYFKIPEECQQESALKAPTRQMLKHLQKLRRLNKF